MEAEALADVAENIDLGFKVANEHKGTQLQPQKSPQLNLNHSKPTIEEVFKITIGCCFCCYWPPVCEFCTNYEVVGFKTRTLNTTDLVSVAYCYVDYLQGEFQNIFPGFSGFGFYRKLARTKTQQGTDKANENKRCAVFSRDLVLLMRA